MEKKYRPLIVIVGSVLLFQLANALINHIRQKKPIYKSAEHIYTGNYCSFIVPENWKDSVSNLAMPGSLIHLESGSEEASVDISVNNFASDIVKDLNDFEEKFHQRLLERYTKTYFSQLGRYSGRGLIMTGKIQNKKDGYVKIFVHSDSISPFFLLECNASLQSKQITKDLQQMETSFKLK